MPYLSHINPDKLLTEHLANVEDIALSHLYQRTKWNGLKDVIKVVTYFHDFGKFSSFFQKYLRTGSYVYGKDHSRLGAYTVFGILEEVDIKRKIFAFEAVARHHQNLKNIEEIYLKRDAKNEEVKKLLLKQIEDLRNNELPNEIKSYLELIQLPERELVREIHKAIKQIINEQNPEYYFYLNYIFSLLIEADKLDASNTPTYNLKDISTDIVEEFINNKVKINSKSDNKLNLLRDQVRKTVIENLNSNAVLEHKIFTLTAPTGIGKTLTAIDFAVKLRDKIHKTKGYIPKIIYALPFVNIIEQTYKIVQELSNEQFRTFAHYHLTDIFDKSFDEDKDEWNDIDKYNKSLMRLETWQADFIITSFVQFFQTLVTNKNRLLKKFNHYAGAIIILDEVQSLPFEYLPLIGAVLHLLTEYLDARILLMTATQPKIFQLAQEYLYQRNEYSNLKINKEINSLELLSNNQEVFNHFNRTYIEPHIDKDMTTDDFQEFFLNNWQGQSALIVCNTISRSIDVFQAIKEVVDDYEQNPVYYLSTNITPYEKRLRIERIKKGMEEGKKPILISTQVVEAGVDLDFDMAFRDIAPIDSIIQVAGRVNRNSKSNKPMPVYIMKFVDDRKDANLVYGLISVEQAEKALAGKERIQEKEYKTLVEKYFDWISNKKSMDKSKEIFDSILKLNYDNLKNFQLIKEQGYKATVFVELDNNARKVRLQYEAMINKEIPKEEFERKYRKIFNQYLINVSEALTDNLSLLADGATKIIYYEELDSYYDSNTGFKRADNQGAITF